MAGDRAFQQVRPNSAGTSSNWYKFPGKTGHVSKQMLKHYSHIRMEAKRKALESVVTDGPSREPKKSLLRIAQDQPLLRRLLKQVTHKSPHNWVSLMVIGACIGGVSLRI